jgi:predicted negative regulator of RcsB-dependent stress response
MGNIKYLFGDQKQAKEAYKKALEISQDKKFKERVRFFLKELKESNRGGP